MADYLSNLNDGATFDALMAKINALTIINSLASTDTTNPLSAYQGKVLNDTDILLLSYLQTGWLPTSATFTFVSADAPIFIISTPINLTGVIEEGMKIQLTQDAVIKNGFVMNCYWDAGTSKFYIKLYGGTLYTITSNAITGVCWSRDKKPKNFPIDPNKWTVQANFTANAEKPSPAAQTWYQMSGHAMTLPIGTWKIDYKVQVRSSCASADLAHYPSAYTTLSTNGSGETDKELTDGMWINNATTNCKVLRGEKVLTVTAKTTVTILTKADDATVYSIAFYSASSQSHIRAVCPYL